MTAVTSIRKGAFTLTDADVIRLTPIVEDVAASLAASNSGISADDVAQEVWAHLLTAWPHVAGKDDAYVKSVARRAGAAYCETERYDFMFHSSQYVYTPVEVRALLTEAYFTEAAWLDAPRKTYGALESITAGGVVVALLDLQRAFDELSPGERDSICARFERGEPAGDAERKRVARAIDEMTRFLNRRMYAATVRRHDGIGSRRVMSNTEAAAWTKALG